MKKSRLTLLMVYKELKIMILKEILFEIEKGLN